MTKKRVWLIYLRLFRPIFHIILLFLSFWFIYNIRFFQIIKDIFSDLPELIFLETLIFTIIAWIIFLWLSFLYWIYELFKPIHWYYRKFLKVWLLWMIIISFIAYLWQWFLFINWISRFILLAWWFTTLFFITFFDIFLNYINSFIEKKNPYNVLFVYSNRKFYERIIKNFRNYLIYDIEWIKYEDINSINKKITDKDIIITVWNFDKNDLQEIFDIIRINDKEFYHISENFFLEDLVYSPSRIWPVLAFEQKPSPLDWWYKVSKRIYDILFSFFFILFFSWLYILIWIFILIKDWRPILYKSKRVWRWWKVFNMYKFRSMVKDAEKLKNDLIEKNERKWPLFKISNDPRVPNWWKILRKTSLDELPQFINVLIWDMSVVWPRPHLEQEVIKYENWQKRLLSVKPWITWYAQIFWRDSLDFDEEAKLDLYYIQNWSLFLDLFVIISTVKVVFSWR